MANAVEACDLDALHQAITTAIQAAFPDLQTVEFYREDRKSFPAPACLLDLCEMEHADFDPGSDQVEVMARFEARFVMGFRTPNAKLAVRKLAAAFMALMRDQLRWTGTDGKAVAGQGPCELIGAYADDFDPALDQYEVWRVEWNQRLWFGESAWKNDGTVPAHVLVSFTPIVGVPHKDEYIDITGST